VRCILDRHLRTPLQSKLVRTARHAPVIIGCDPAAIQTPMADALRSAGVQWVPTTKLEEFLRHLHDLKVSHLLVEPGPILAAAFFEAGLADRAWIFRCASFANDQSAPRAAMIPDHLCESGRLSLGGDSLHEYINLESAVYFSCSPSADLTLESGLAASKN
jgi:riboflavin biosynthesis pyrimidine reductase